jgi:RNA polymerase sigma-70 factor (ECF subfamily)
VESRPGAGEPSDEDLARRAQAGDADAFAVLVVRYQRAVLNLAYRMLGDAQEAEDVAQDVFVRAYQSLDRFDPARRFFSWLYRIAVNRCLSYRARPRPDTLDAGAHLAVPDAAPSPEQQAARHETQAAIRAAIAALPEHERALVALRYGAELSYEEIAATMQLPLGTVKTRLFRARQRLAGLLEEEGDGAF